MRPHISLSKTDFQTYNHVVNQIAKGNIHISTCSSFPPKYNTISSKMKTSKREDLPSGKGTEDLTFRCNESMIPLIDTPGKSWQVC